MTEIYDDALKEAGNVAAGKATSLLSQTIKQKVDLSHTKITLTTIDQIPKLIKIRKNKNIAGTYSHIYGDVNGSVAMMFPVEKALEFADLLASRKGTKNFTDEDKANFERVGDILAESYLDALSTFLGIKLSHRSTDFISILGESVLDFILHGTDKFSEGFLVVVSNFSIPETDIEGDFILLLSVKHLGKLLLSIQEKLKQ